MSDLSASYFLAINGRSANNLIWAQGYLGKKKGLCNFLHVYVYCFPAIYSIYLWQLIHSQIHVNEAYLSS